jgi:hypothetical protein
MTKEDAAAALNGNEYREEGSKELFAAMKADGLVAVFGASDDLMEFRGAINDEAYPGSGGVVLFDRNGVVPDERDDDDDDDDMLVYLLRKKQASKIEAEWDIGSGFSWTYKTEIPHETFIVLESDGEEDPEQYCRGLVFALSDIPA